MPLESIPFGQPTTILEDTTYALPAAAGWIIASAPLEFSLDNSNWSAAVAATTTTGVKTAWPFVRCTSAAAIVSIKRD